MNVLDQGPVPAQTAPAQAAPVFFDARAEFAARFLSGRGLEIGALHLPLATPPQAHVSYVDRMPLEELRREYPELAKWKLTPVDVIDNGEVLATISEGSQDFIIANHFLEHCEDPVRTIGIHMSKLKPGGVLFYAVPDKRYTFDFQRQSTPIDHMIGDYEHGPERSRREHYEEWTRLVIVNPSESASESSERARELESAAYSIHMHVWTQAGFLQLLLHCRERLGESFDIEAAARQAIEFVVVLRKTGGSQRPTTPVTSPGIRQRWRRLYGRALATARIASRRRAQR